MKDYHLRRAHELSVDAKAAFDRGYHTLAATLYRQADRQRELHYGFPVNWQAIPSGGVPDVQPQVKGARRPKRQPLQEKRRFIAGTELTSVNNVRRVKT